MGKSIKGKELGKGITQRKSDGLYQGRFVNRFGKTQNIYASNLNELRKRMREEQYEDEKALNVVTKDVTLDDSRTWLLADDNGFVLSCDRGYTVYRDDEDGKGCVSSKVCSKAILRIRGSPEPL